MVDMPGEIWATDVRMHDCSLPYWWTAATGTSVKYIRTDKVDGLVRALEFIRDNEGNGTRVSAYPESQYDINKAMKNKAKEALASFSQTEGG